MKLYHRNENNICVVSIDGNMTFDETSVLKEYIHPFLEDEAIAGLVFNLDKLEFIDSSGIVVFIDAYEILKQRQSKLAVCHMSQSVLEIFEITHLDKFINIFETEEEAISGII